MGGKVAGVPVGTGVARPAEVSPPADHGFGNWYRGQRELRGISVYYVAARTKLRPERIHAIELALDPLCPDGRGRVMARELAQAIGADPTEAIVRLMGTGAAGSAADRGAAAPGRRRWQRHGPRALLSAALVAIGWLLVSWLLEVGDDASTQIVHRPDYVQQALDEMR